MPRRQSGDRCGGVARRAGGGRGHPDPREIGVGAASLRSPRSCRKSGRGGESGFLFVPREPDLRQEGDSWGRGQKRGKGGGDRRGRRGKGSSPIPFPTAWPSADSHLIGQRQSALTHGPGEGGG